MNKKEKTGIRQDSRVRRAVAVAAVIVAVGAAAMLLRSRLFSEEKKKNNSTDTEAVPTIPHASVPPITITPDPLADFCLTEAYYPEVEKTAYGGSIDYDAKTQAERGLARFIEASLPELLAGEDGTNRACAPLNIYLALGMLAEVTDGNTRVQVLEVLGADKAWKLRKIADEAWKAAYRDDGKVTSLLGSSLWLREGAKIIPYELNPLVVLADSYHASTFRGQMGSDVYDQALRTWINEQTGGLLKESAKQLSFDEKTILALATTVYFRVRWESEFAKSATDRQVFHTLTGDKECDFMHDSVKRRYYAGDRFSAVTYGFDGVSAGDMIFFLPDEGVDVKELLTDPQVISLLGSGQNVPQSKLLTVNSSVPKFDILTDNADLTECMKKLGITDVFQPGVADFSSLLAEPDGAYLDGVMHSARVKIDEEGVEAAAYTVMMTEGAALPPEPEEIVDFVLDRPFLFAIRTDNGMTLFAGIVENPS